MSKVLAFMADGTEEAECVTVIDLLLRAGITAETVSVSERLWIQGSHGIEIKADATIETADFSDVDMLFLPGGMPGVTNLAESRALADLLIEHARQNRRIAAICAAPALLGDLGLLRGKTVTCYPGFEDRLIGARYTSRGVITDGNITTARGLGFAKEMGLELIRLLVGKAAADSVHNRIQRA